jgi:hypothetical protein
MNERKEREQKSLAAFKAAQRGEKSAPNARAVQEATATAAFRAAGLGVKGNPTEAQKKETTQAAAFKKVLDSTPQKRAARIGAMFGPNFLRDLAKATPAERAVVSQKLQKLTDECRARMAQRKATTMIR